MCTVTVVAAGDTVRLVCNRDELRSRPAALLPRVTPVGRHRAIFPVDPVSGGTWVAVNDAGLVLTLLNAYSTEPSRESGPLRSRGTIIPSLLHHGMLPAVIEQAARIDATRYAPFRLVLGARQEWAELRSDGQEVRLIARAELDQPLLFTSSGLGDDRVEGPRRQLFDELVRSSDEPFRQQELFHRHRWPERPQLSVAMQRPDARTVSQTHVCLGPDQVTLTYHPDAPDQPVEPRILSLELARTNRKRAAGFIPGVQTAGVKPAARYESVLLTKGAAR